MPISVVGIGSEVKKSEGRKKKKKKKKQNKTKPTAMVHTRSGAKGQETTDKAGEPSGPARAKNIVKSDNGVMKKRTEGRKPKTTEKKKQQKELESIKKDVEEVYSVV